MVFLTQTKVKEDDLMCKYSTLTRLRRILSYCLRFRNNCRVNKRERETGFLSTQELNQAFKILIKKAQLDTFQSEIDMLKKANQLKPKNQLASLNPFLDPDGLLRVGGRIDQANLAYEFKHPIILPKSNHLTRLIVTDLHIRYLHAGQRQLLHMLNSRYCIFGVRQLVKRCVHKCVTCARFKGKPYNQQMGNLPAHRLQPGFAFTNTGVDYAGPVMVRSWKGRGAKTHKAYIALFICLATRAIHLELCGDLSTESFIADLRRFVSRRGLCSNIFSDNGSNFVGAERHFGELKELLRSPRHADRIVNFLTDYNVQWHFIPPAAPHFGGLWEAGVKSMKTHLRRVLGNSLLTFEEYNTLLCQVEACLNSRPLLTLSTDVKEADYLTPGHFLIGRPLTQVPQENFKEHKINRLNRWQYIQRLIQDFWKRWAMEYLTQLQQRSRWRSQSVNPKVGDIVLIKDENLPPGRWPMGRITQLHPGGDNLVRVVTVRTVTGVFKRPIIKLCPMPTEADE